MILNKKSQITIFVVIGIIILIGASLFFLFRKTSQTPSEQEIIQASSEVPVEFQPINDYIVSCIAKIGEEGIKQVGFHGGYADLNKYGIQANAGNPTNSRAFLFNSDDTKSGVAYWYYFRSDNKCETGCECSTEQPFLKKSEGSPSIEKQLEDYMNENLDLCLADFEIFKKQGFDVTTDEEIKTTVSVREHDVLFNVRYDIDVKKDSSKSNIRNFIKILPLELKKIYELANGIKEMQSNFTYLERWTLEQISGSGLGLNENGLPPIAASEIDPGEKPAYWIKSKVKNDIQYNMLPVYTPFFTVFGTSNYNSNLIGSFYEKTILPIPSPTNSSYSDLSVKFNYLSWWPIYFDITGRGVTGQRIGPEKMSSSFFNFIGIKRYNFYYDLSYPVLVDIYDPNAFNFEGYHFYIGLESNVRNNREVNCSGPGLTRYAVPTGSLFCESSQECANITISTKDAKTGLSLENVNVYYSSGEESCEKGFSENGAVMATLPSCVGSGCSINAVKEGYWTYPQSYAVRCDKIGGICLSNDVLCNGESLILNMEPLRNKNITVMKKKMIKQVSKTWVFSDAAENLVPSEYAVISLQKIKENPAEEDLVLAGVFYGNETSIELLPGMVPGNYELKIDLFYKFPDYLGRNSVIFASVEECTKKLGGLLGDDCVTIGPYPFNETMVEGGFSANVTFTKDMLDNYNNIIFYAISAPDIDTYYSALDAYDMEEMGKTEDYSLIYKVNLLPTSQ